MKLSLQQRNSAFIELLLFVSTILVSALITRQTHARDLSNSTVEIAIPSSSSRGSEGLYDVRIPIKITVKPSLKPRSITKKASGEQDEAKSSSITVEPSVLSSTPPPPTKSPTKPNVLHYKAKEISYFLESHPAAWIHDPRAYLTDERVGRALAIMLGDLSAVPKRLRFAQTVRIFHEIGRKIVGKLNYYASEVAALLAKNPDELGNKLEVGMLVDSMNKAFDSKDDVNPRDATGKWSREGSIDWLTRNDPDKQVTLDASIAESSVRLAQILSHFVLTAKKRQLLPSSNSDNHMGKLEIELLSDALLDGAKLFMKTLSWDDKNKITKEVARLALKFLNITGAVLARRLQKSDDSVHLSVRKLYEQQGARQFADLNKLTDRTALLGPWNSYLFTNLGSSERVVKLFSSLLTRVSGATQKERWINAYWIQVKLELERSLPAFVVMQSMPFVGNSSEHYLLHLDGHNVSMLSRHSRTGYARDKARIPGRCYLAGRRWRMLLVRATAGAETADEVLAMFAREIGQFKLGSLGQTGNDFHRLCLPPLEAGIRGWSIDGDPKRGSGSQSGSQFPLKNPPISNLDTLPDPFTSGVLIGHSIGFKIGYNEQRNASLELEGSENGPEVEYLARASYRRAATEAATRSFELAIREGYLVSSKLSVQAGIKIPADAGMSLCIVRCLQQGRQVGQEVGQAVVEAHLAGKQVDVEKRSQLMEIGRTQGLLAGVEIGRTIGAIVGKSAAEEAFKRTLLRGGNSDYTKFMLDEYEAGAKLAFSRALSEGKKLAVSSNLDSSAPKYFSLRIPASSNDKAHDADHWEKDLIPNVNSELVDQLQIIRNHTVVKGVLRGDYKLETITLKGFKHLDISNRTVSVLAKATGYMRGNIAYLTLNGTVNELGHLSGSFVTRAFNNNITTTRLTE